MSSVSSAHTASTAIRVVAPAAARPVEAVPAATRDAGTSSEAAKAAKLASSTAPPAPSTPAAALTQAQLAEEVHALQEKMDKLNPALAFVLDQDSGKAVIQLTDRTTKEVIQQFPSEAAMQISKALDRFEKGQLIHITV